jgi:hypothetical protein
VPKVFAAQLLSEGNAEYLFDQTVNRVSGSFFWNSTQIALEIPILGIFFFVLKDFSVSYFPT